MNLKKIVLLLFDQINFSLKCNILKLKNTDVVNCANRSIVLASNLDLLKGYDFWKFVNQKVIFWKTELLKIKKKRFFNHAKTCNCYTNTCVSVFTSHKKNKFNFDSLLNFYLLFICGENIQSHNLKHYFQNAFLYTTPSENNFGN